MRRHVLRVTRVHDEDVSSSEHVAVAECRHVVGGEEVDPLPGPVQPGDEVEIPVAEPKRDAEVEERPGELDAPRRAAHVPAVAPAIAVRVPEVVRLPGVRGQDDGDARERGQPLDDERRVPNPPVGSAEPKEVEAARPVAGPDHPQQAGSVPVVSPVHSDRARHRGAERLEVAPAFHGATRVVEDLQPQRRGVGRDVQLGLLAARVAPAWEAGLDPEDPHDRRAAPLAGEVHVDAAADPKAQHVRSRLGVPGGPPDDLPLPGPEPTRRAPDRRRRPAGAERVRSQHVEPHGRSAVEPEPDDRTVAKPVAVRRDGRQERAVPGEGLRAVRDVHAVQRGRRDREEKRERAHAGRIRMPKREATNGIVEPCTITENATTTKTISYRRRASSTSARIANAASRIGTAPLNPLQAMKSFSPVLRRSGTSSGKRPTGRATNASATARTRPSRQMFSSRSWSTLTVSPRATKTTISARLARAMWKRLTCRLNGRSRSPRTRPAMKTARNPEPPATDASP